jgi:hypothetical protein
VVGPIHENHSNENSFEVEILTTKIGISELSFWTSLESFTSTDRHFKTVSPRIFSIGTIFLEDEDFPEHRAFVKDVFQWVTMDSLTYR